MREMFISDHGNYEEKSLKVAAQGRQKSFLDQEADGIHAAKMEFLSGRVDRNETMLTCRCTSQRFG